MNTWYIEPRDPFIVRDGRPNSGRSESTTLPFPWPHTVAGMVRTRLGSTAEGNFELHAHLDALRQVAMRGPLLADPATGARWVPAPRDALVLESEGVRHVLHLHPLERDACLTDGAGGGDLALVGLDEEEAIDGKPPRDVPAFWPEEALHRWLESPASLHASGAQEFLADAFKPLPMESRVHVKLGEFRTAEEGMLFQTRGLRFADDKWRRLALAVDVDVGPLAAIEPRRGLRVGVGPAGGERRLVRWDEAANVTWPDLPATIERALTDPATKAVRARVVLLTPGIFAEGWRPASGGLLASSDGLTVRLIGACVPRPETISGWDFEKQQPKATRRVVSAGAVYWVELEGDAEARRSWARAVWMKNVSDAEQDRRDGFGLAAVGVAR